MDPDLSLRQVFRGLYDNASNKIHVSSHLAILSAIRDVCKLVVKELTSWVCRPFHSPKFCLLTCEKDIRLVTPRFFSKL